MSTIKVLGICGSLRRASANMGLLRHAASCLPAGMELQIADLSEVPFYNADLASKPAPVARLLEQIGEADALLLACPEYNYSMAPALKTRWIGHHASRRTSCWPVNRSPSWGLAAAWALLARSTIFGKPACFSTCFR